MAKRRGVKKRETAAEKRARERRIEEAIERARKKQDVLATKRRQKRERDKRIAGARAMLEPLLANMVSKIDSPTFWSDTRDIHANWYSNKMHLANVMPGKEYEAVLEALADDYDTEEIGWDIIY